MFLKEYQSTVDIEKRIRNCLGMKYYFEDVVRPRTTGIQNGVVVGGQNCMFKKMLNERTIYKVPNFMCC